MIKKIFIVYFLAFYPILSYGSGVSVDGSTNTTIDKARNNTPIINIANPNTNGLSHNKFTSYNVDSKGLIINNATTTNANTKLGGIIFGNPNLTSNAKIILNEITSTNKSHLNGWSEIAGQTADIVIANPNGISINGAGFINSNNITLTTGIPQLDNGNLSAFKVKAGTINIEGAGLNLDNQNSANIYSDYLVINAKINANKLSIILGKNYIKGDSVINSYSTNQTNLLLDSSKLGGMYANSIFIVGNGNGLGVNLPPEVFATAGDISIDNDGSIILHKVSSNNNINLRSNADIKINDTIHANDDIKIKATGATYVSNGSLVASNIEVKTAELNNANLIVAKINSNKIRSGNLLINANKITNSNNIKATNINIKSDTIVNTKTILANNKLNVDAINIDNQGTIYAKNNNITTTNLKNNNTIQAAEQLNIKAQDINIVAGKVSAEKVVIATDDLQVSGDILANKDLTLQINNKLTNDGNIQADNLVLTADTIKNNEKIIAQTSKITASKLTNDGNIQADNLVLTADTIKNNEKIIAQTSKITASKLTNDQDIIVNNLTIAADNILNNGDLKSHKLAINSAMLNNQHNIIADIINLDGSQLDNSGLIQAVNANNITINDINNNGIFTSSNLNINASNIINNKRLYASDTINIQTQSLTNSATIAASTKLNIDATTINTTNGEISSDDIQVRADNLTNNNTNILSLNDINLNVKDSILNNGLLQANNAVLIDADNLANHANLVATKIMLNLAELSNFADIVADDIKIISTTFVNNAKINASDLVLQSNNFSNNAKASISSSDVLTINNTSKFNNKGIVHSNNTSNINTKTLNNNADISAKTLIINSAKLNNTSNISAVQGIDINADNINNTGLIQANKDLVITTTAALTNNGDLVAHNLHLNNNSITNTNNILAGNNLLINTNNILNNAGSIKADNLLNITSNQLNNQQHGLISSNALSATIEKLNNFGNLQSATNLQLTTKQLNNNLTAKILANNNLTLNSQDIDNKGAMHANKHIKISAQNLANNNLITSTGGLSLDTSNLNLTGGVMQAENLNIIANNFNLSTANVLVSNNIDLQIAQSFSNSGNIQANNLLNIATKIFNNSKRMIAKDLTLKSIDIFNNGDILATNNIDVVSQQLNNSAQLNANNKLTIKSTNIDNTKDILANKIIVNSNILNNNGKMQASNNLAIVADAIANLGLITADNLNITTAELGNQKTIYATNNNINATKLNNSHNIGASKQLKITANDITSSAGDISATNIDISANNLQTSNANILAIQDLNLKIKDNLINKSLIQANANLNIDALNLDNNGSLISNDVVLNTSNITNNKDILANNNITINNQVKLDNQGTIKANNLLNLNSTQLNNKNAGTIIAAKQTTISTNIVNAGNLQAHDLQLTAEKINNKLGSNIVASNNLKLKAKQLENTGVIHANNYNNIIVDNINNNANIGANKQLNITTQKLSTTNGEIRANNINIDADNLDANKSKILAVTNIDLQIANILNNAGVIEANKQLNITTQKLSTTNGEIRANNINIDADNLDANKSKILAVTNIDLQIANILNNAGVIEANKQLNIKVKTINNKKRLMANNLKLITDNINNSANILAINNINIENKNTITNPGNIKSNNNILINTDQLLNDNNIVALNTNLTINKIHNSGTIQASNLDLLSVDLTNAINGVLRADNTNIITTKLSNLGDILAIKRLELQANNIKNQANIKANQILNITSNDLNNKASGVLLGNDLSISTNDIKNYGNILSINNLNILNSNNIGNHGIIQANEQLNITSKKLNNQQAASIGAKDLKLNIATIANNFGKIQARNLDLHSNNLSNKQNANIIAADKLILDANNNLDNQGSIHSNKQHTITSKTIHNSGNLSSSKQLAINSQSIDNSNQINAQSIDLKSDYLNNSGNILSTDDLILTHKIITNDGTLKTNNNLKIKANTLNNNKLIVANNANLNINGINNHGIIHGYKLLTIASVNLDNTKQLSSDKNINIKSTDFNNSKLSALANIVVNADNLSNNNGNIINNQDLTLNITKSINNINGTMQSNFATITSPQLNNTNGNINAKHRLNLSTKDMQLDNSNIYSGKDLIINLASLDNKANSNIGSGGNLTINAPNYIVNRAQLTANGNFKLTTAGDLTNNNLISSQKALTISANNLTNNKTISGGVGNTSLNINNNITNRSRISSMQNLTAEAKDIANNGFFNAGKDLTLKTSNKLTNNKTLFASNNMKLYVTNQLDNTKRANIFAINNLTIAKDKHNNKTNTVNNKSANMYAYNGDIVINANALNNISIANPVVEVINSHAILLSKGTVPLSEIKRNNVSITQRSLERINYNNYIPSNIIGSNINIDANTHNKHSLISSSNDIVFNGSLNNEASIQAYKRTYVHNYVESYRNAHGYGKAWYRIDNETEGHDVDVIIESVHSTIQAGGSISGNISKLDNGNIKEGISASITPSQTQNTQTTKNTQTNTSNQTLSSNTKAVATTSKQFKQQTTQQKNIKNSQQIIKKDAIATNTINTSNKNINSKDINLQGINLQNQNQTSKKITIATITNAKQEVTNKPNLITQVKDSSKPTAQIQKTIIAQTNITPAPSPSIAPVLTPRIAPAPNITPKFKTIASIKPIDIIIEIPTDELGLFVKSKKPNSNYLIESNPEFVIYENFISSKYLLDKLKFNPDIVLRQIGDAFYQQGLVKQQILAKTGRRFLNSNPEDNITTDNEQYQRLMDNAISQQAELDLVAGISLTDKQISQLRSDIVWLEQQSITLDNKTQIVLVPKVYLANPNNYKIRGSQIIAGKNINLKVGNLNNAGLLQAGNNIQIQATDQITNQGANIIAGTQASLLANNDINNISANITAKNIKLISINGDINSQRYSKDVTYKTSTSTQNTQLIGEQSNIVATNKLNIVGNNNVNIKGSNIVAKGLNIAANNINITTTVQKQDLFSNSKNYIKSTKNLLSNIQANNINLNANHQITLKGAQLNATNKLSIDTQILNIAAVKDTSYQQIHSESSGGFFGGGHNSTNTKQSITNVASNISAKDLTINARITKIVASKLQAETANITTDILNLVSDKDLDFAQNQSDSSRLFTRKVSDKGHYTESKIDAEINASKKLTINGTQLTNSQQQNLSKLASSDSFSQNLQDKLRAQGITLQDTTTNNQNWDQSKITLTGLGKIIVQVAASYLTIGASDTFINAAMSSVKSQIISKIIESMITHEPINFDAKAILKTAVTAGAIKYATAKLEKAGIIKNPLKNMSTKDYAQNATTKALIQGTSIKIQGGEFKDGFKAAALTSIISDGAIQMRKYVKDNFEYAGKNGEKVAKDTQSVGVRGDNVKLAGSHRDKDGREILDATFGGSQIGARKIVVTPSFKIDYAKAGTLDQALEYFAGPHDFISSWNYKNVDGQTRLKFGGTLNKAISGMLLVPALPFAAAPVIEDNMISIGQIKLGMDKDKKTIQDFKGQHQFNLQP